MNGLKRSLLVLFRFSPRTRTAMVAALDVGVCVFAVLLAYSLRVGEWRILSKPLVSLLFLSSALWLTIASLQGVYRSVLRFSGVDSIKDIGRSCVILAVVLTGFLVFLNIPNGAPRTLSVLVPLILFLLLATVRLVLASLLRETLYSRSRRGRRHVLIYGAGVAGRELALSISEDPEFHIAGFIDDDEVLRGRRIAGHQIRHSSDLPSFLSTAAVDEVLLAMPSASRSRRREIVDEIRELAPAVGVRSLPNIAEIASGRVSVSDLREIQIEELLGRDQVAPDRKLMAANVCDCCVMVTGAGGSIGSELCRQILMHSPKRIVLAERSELSLYLIERDLRELSDRNMLSVEIVAMLVDVADVGDVERVYEQLRPDTVFHAAAYKHVPLVQADPIAGIRNNVLGTYYCCLLAERYGAKNFTLVSTDKAVRPSSVMGASKRVCELVVQARSIIQDSTTYSAVRFGNVLGSSGSVVPLFRHQIANGGPVTITHCEATRYFMTVSEAAQLVVQAGAMADGGEIFLLDMGEPVRIYDLAKMMIQLSGLSVVGEDGREGDIEITEIGLRPGEKIHEELLIENKDEPTFHPRIVKASESAPDVALFESRFEALLASLEARDSQKALAQLDELISLEGSTPGHGPRRTTARSARERDLLRSSSSTQPRAFRA